MDVFVIPVGRDQYELYCEVPDTGVESDAAPTSFLGRIRDRFALMLRAAEERRQRGAADAAPATRMGRAQERLLGWVAERIAEQRLLWNLRRETAAVLAHPEDMTFEQVLTLLQRMLQRDYERHRRWLIFDAILLIGTGVLAVLPGPNVVAYYFAFRVWGHWLSMRGASQGRHRVTWTGRICPPLRELRELAPLAPTERAARVRDIADRLRLQHLSSFFDRVAVRHA